MENINQNTLVGKISNIANTVRNKLSLPYEYEAEQETGNMIMRDVTLLSHSPNIDDEGVKQEEYSRNLAYTNVYTIPNATSLKVTIYYATYNSNEGVCLWEGNYPTYTYQNDGGASRSGRLYGYGSIRYDAVQSHIQARQTSYIISGDTCTIGFKSTSVDYSSYGYYAVITGYGLGPETEMVTKYNTFTLDELNDKINTGLKGNKLDTVIKFSQTSNWVVDDVILEDFIENFDDVNHLTLRWGNVDSSSSAFSTVHFNKAVCWSGSNTTYGDRYGDRLKYVFRVTSDALGGMSAPKLNQPPEKVAISYSSSNSPTLINQCAYVGITSEGKLCGPYYASTTYSGRGLMISSYTSTQPASFLIIVD